MGVSLPAYKLDVGQIGIDQAQLPTVAIEPGVMAGAAVSRQPIDLRGWFAPAIRDRPLELEIGSGKGTFLVGQAQAAADCNYLGIEWAKAFWRYAADRCRRRELTNVRLVRAEAGAFVRQYVADATFRQIHIYFPDPWPKKRHHKRRLIQTPFLVELHRVLEPGGQVRLATDHADYFAWMTEHAAAAAQWFDRLPFEPPKSAGRDEWVGSNFERKYRREGRVFQGMVLRKRG